MHQQESPPQYLERTIQSTRIIWSPNLGELFAYRHMIYYLILRNFTATYKQTILGPLWVIVTPLVTMVLFTFVFGTISKVATNGIPYPIFSYSALVPWTLFSATLTTGTMSISKNAGMITKVYFPRLTMPFVEAGVNLANFGISLGSLFLLMLLFGYLPTWNIVWLPVFVMITMFIAIGVALWMAPLNVWSRDIQRGIIFVVTAWMYFSPVAYPREQAPDFVAHLMGFNPMTSVVEGFRWVFLDSTPPDVQAVALSTVIGIIVFYTGLIFFKNMEQTFADVI